MILVRMVFQAKWGKAGAVAASFQENAETMRRVIGPNVPVRILTDLTGPFDTVVQEMTFESLAEWERIRTGMFSNPEMQQMSDNSESPFKSGQMEVYTIEATFGGKE